MTALISDDHHILVIIIYLIPTLFRRNEKFRNVSKD